jgi:hypothetical protein
MDQNETLRCSFMNLKISPTDLLGFVFSVEENRERPEFYFSPQKICHDAVKSQGYMGKGVIYVSLSGRMVKKKPSYWIPFHLTQEHADRAYTIFLV